IWSSRVPFAAVLMAATVGSACYAGVAQESPGVATGARGGLPTRLQHHTSGSRSGQRRAASGARTSATRALVYANRAFVHGVGGHVRRTRVPKRKTRGHRGQGTEAR